MSRLSKTKSSTWQHMVPECEYATLCSWNMTPITPHVSNTAGNFGYAGLKVQGHSLRDSVKSGTNYICRATDSGAERSPGSTYSPAGN